MRVYTYSEARQRLSEVLDIARGEEVVIKRRGGETFSVKVKTSPKSPFDILGIETNVTTADILDAIKESRSGRTEQKTKKDRLCELGQKEGLE